MQKLFIRLWAQLEEHRKKSFFILLFLMFLSSLAELLSLAMLIPFMGVMLNPNKFKENEYVINIFEYLNLNIENNFVLYITIAFISITLLAGIIRYALLVYNSRFTFSTSSELAIKIYKTVLSQSFENHISLNSSFIIDGITQKVNSTIYAGVQPFLVFVTSIIVSFNIILFLLFVNVKVVITSVVIFATIYLLIVFFLKKRIHKLSQIFPEKSTQALKVVQEGLGNIRDILIDKVQNVYTERFSTFDISYKTAQRDSLIYGGIPKIIIEALLMISIACVLFFLTSSNVNIVELIPVFSVFIFSAQKLLPLIQSIYSSYTSMMSARYSILDVLTLLEIESSFEKQNKIKIDFNKNLELRNVDFKYKNTTKEVIKNLNLKIKKNEKLGIIGETGSGKSTLADILMGLLVLKKGKFYVDEREIIIENISSWQDNIAHVPQYIYLSDATIYENIGFGISYEKIDKLKVRDIIKKVGLEKLVIELPDGLDTVVGERGSKLSGGQRQRIGIARALYKNANVLFLDESTSALDNETEKSIMEIIDNLDDITIIMIAHRISSLSICNRIIELEKGKIIRECTYEDLVKK